jgi:hypothetical protein
MPSFAHHNSVYLRDRLEEIGGYDPCYRIGYDTLFINALRLVGEIGFVDHTLYHYRRFDFSSHNRSLTSSSTTGKGSSFREQVRVNLVDRWESFTGLLDFGTDVATEFLRAQRDSSTEHLVATYASAFATSCVR